MAAAIIQGPEITRMFVDFAMEQPLETLDNPDQLFRTFIESIEGWFLLAAMAKNRMLGLCKCCYISTAPAFSRVMQKNIIRRRVKNEPNWDPMHIIALAKAGYNPNILDTDRMGALQHLVWHVGLRNNLHGFVRRMNAFAAPLLFQTGFSIVDHKHPITGRTALQIMVHTWLHQSGCSRSVLDLIEMLLEAGADPFLPSHRYPRASSTMALAKSNNGGYKRWALLEVLSKSSVQVNRRSRFYFAALFATRYGNGRARASGSSMPFASLPLDVKKIVSSYFNPLSPIDKKRKYVRHPLVEAQRKKIRI